MANESIQLRAKAKLLGVENYRNLSMDELRAAIKRAEGSSGGTGDKSAKAASTNGKSAGRKGTAKAKTAATKGTAKTASRKSAASAKSAPAKSTTQKTASGRKSAASGTAKRPATGASTKTAATKRGTAKVTNRKAAKAQAQPKARSENPGRIPIIDGEIDWTLESSVGNDPKSNRGIIMKAIRRFKGNTEKVFSHLADKATEMYPKGDNGRKRSKDSAQTLLRWHISRCKLDYVKSTEQHPEADNPNYRKAANARFGRKVRATPAKATGSARKPAATKTAGKSTRKPAAAQKTAQGRTKARPARGAQRPGRKTAAGKGNPRSRSRSTGTSAASRKRGSK